jgi:hypothetical protein
MYILATTVGDWEQFAVMRGIEAKPGIVGWKGILAQFRVVYAQLDTFWYSLRLRSTWRRPPFGR